MNTQADGKKHIWESVRNALIYCGLSKEEFYKVMPLVIMRNYDMLAKSSVLMMIFGVVLAVLNLIMSPEYMLPYTVLAAGGLLMFLCRRMMPQLEGMKALVLCYLQIVLVFGSAILLSAQGGNISYPSTSIVVVLAIIPFTVTDRPVRMYAVVVASAVAFLLISSSEKPMRVFDMDVWNTLPFTILGMVFYLVICNRSVREISQKERIISMQQKMILSMADLIEARDEDTGSHIMRTEEYVTELTGKMEHQPRYAGLSKAFLENIRRAAPLHDIGKIKIPDSILDKEGPLTDEEYAVMKKHCEYGAEIIRKTLWKMEEKDYCDVAYNVALYHHEKYDGSGYPQGLKGEDIPLEARIMALADVYDALVSPRVYKNAYPVSEARKIIAEGRGTRFDPYLTDLFLS